MTLGIHALILWLLGEEGVRKRTPSGLDYSSASYAEGLGRLYGGLLSGKKPIFVVPCMAVRALPNVAISGLL